MDIVRTTADLRAHVRRWRQSGESVGLVPTMGGLHDGHLSLIRASKAATERTIATLFVNPAQFAPGEDLATYPRDEARDHGLFEAEGTDLLFAPDVSTMYPDGFATQIDVGELGAVLEGVTRPHFFAGVATVVAKLLLQSLPDTAFFGDKDYQQLLVIRRMALDMDIPVEIAGVETVREADGLAMSSRNQYLSDSERAAAPALYAAISEVAETVGDGGNAGTACRAAQERITGAGFDRVDYITVRDAETLAPIDGSPRPARVLAAAHLGRARLIDNVAI